MMTVERGITRNLYFLVSVRYKRIYEIEVSRNKTVQQVANQDITLTLVSEKLQPLSIVSSA